MRASFLARRWNARRPSSRRSVCCPEISLPERPHGSSRGSWLYAAGLFPDVHGNSWLAGVIFLLSALLLIPPCANIAILVYARTVTRREEFAARTALGASRGRIVMQIFVEVLVLAAGAGLAGFLLAREFSGRSPSCSRP